MSSTDSSRLFGHDDQRVDLVGERLDALARPARARREPSKPNGFGDDADGERAQLARDARDDGAAPVPVPPPAPAVMKIMSEPFSSALMRS